MANRVSEAGEADGDGATATAAAPGAKDRQFVTALARGLEVLRAFAPAEERFTLTVQGDIQQTVSEFDDLDGYLGAEASLRGILYLRGGYAWTAAGRQGASLGIGLRYDRLLVDLGRSFNDFSGFDSDTPFQLSIGFGF